MTHVEIVFPYFKCPFAAAAVLFSLKVLTALKYDPGISTEQAHCSGGNE